MHPNGSGNGARKAHTLLAALSHPLRVRILEVLNERKMSPSEFVEKGLIPPEQFSNFQQALSLASYHFRELEKAGLLEVAETVPRRGAVEHVYGGLVLLSEDRDETGNMQKTDQRRVSTMTFLGLVARADAALRNNQFDSRSNRQLNWTLAALDRQGWKEAMRALSDAFKNIKKIESSAATRLSRSGEDPISAVIGVLGFESAPIYFSGQPDDDPPRSPE